MSPLMGIVVLAVSTFAIAASNKTKTPARATARPAKFTLGSPIVHENLTVFPVYSREARKISDDYLTLDEALKEQLIIVKELPDAVVNRVSITNKASKPIYLISGDIILGGQQDRVISKDTIIPKGARDFAVEVFCVEHGRWQGASHFMAGTMASGGLRYETQRTKEQAKVWDKVAAEARLMKAETPSGTYRAVAGKKDAQKNIDAYVKKTQASLVRDLKAVGVVVAVNGKVSAGDVFADRKLFQKQLPKILKSYALDAVQDKSGWAKSKKPKASAKDAMALLTDSGRGARRTTRNGSTMNAERETNGTILFEAMPSARDGRGPAAPVHQSLFRKK